MGVEPWIVPPLWEEATVAVIGGGPSVTTTNLDLVKHLRVIGVNDAFRLGSWVDVVWWGDNSWFTWNRKAVLRFSGIKACCQPKCKGIPGVFWLQRGKRFGLDARKHVVSWNLNSGISAINLALHLGAKKVILIGFDMRSVDGKANYHSNHKNKPNKNPWNRFLQNIHLVAQDAKSYGLEVINATPGSAMKAFPVLTLEEAL